MVVKDKDLDGYNSQLSIQRNTQRSEIIIHLQKKYVIILTSFTLHTLRIFNTLY